MSGIVAHTHSLTLSLSLSLSLSPPPPPLPFHRFQVQRGIDDPNRYKSYSDCVKKMIRNEG